MRASSGVSSLDQEFQVRPRTVAGVTVTSGAPSSRGRRVGVITSLAIIGAAVWIGWIIGSGRLPGIVETVKAMLPW